MSQDNICPRSEKCLIFNTPLGGEIVTHAYRNQFCYNGQNGRNNCKRNLVMQRVGKAPLELLPNARKTVEEIIEQMRIDGEL